MLKAFLILLLACVATAAFSQQPPQRTGIESNQQSESAGDRERDAERKRDEATKLGRSLEISPDDHLNKKTDRQSEHATESAGEYWTIFDRPLKITDTLLAAFTLFLVLVGAWQGWHLRSTVQSFISGERPYIYADAPILAQLLPTGAKSLYPLSGSVPLPIVQCVFVNIGKTPGIIREIRAEIIIGSVIPTNPTFTYSIPVKGEVIARPDKATGIYPFEFNRNFTADEIEAIGAGKVPIIFFGYVKFTDVFQNLHTKGFGFVARMNSGCQVCGGKNYNYSHTQKAPNAYLT